MTKITIDRSTVEQALEALKESLYATTDKSQFLAFEAITALRAALAEPVQEPVAWASKRALARIKDFDSTIYANGGFDDAVPLYTAPPQRLPLTEEEIEKAYREIWRDLPSDFAHTSSGWIEQGIKYAERAHGIE